MALLTGCYLLFSKANAFATDITPPVRLRRWTGVFLVSIAMNHVWYMPLFFLSSSDDILSIELIGGMLDNLTVFPLSIAILLVMLQDRRRPLWPICVLTAPIALGMAVCIVKHSSALYPIIYAYVVLLTFGSIIYMVREVRRYGRWLRDNYADLENKEVWQSFVVLAIILLVYVFYEFSDDGPAYPYVMQAVSIVLNCYLLWRVETLSDMSIPATHGHEDLAPHTLADDNDLSQSTARHFRSEPGQADRHQSVLSQQVLCFAGHHLQCLYQRAAHPAFRQALSRDNRQPSVYVDQATGFPEWFPQLQYIQCRLQAEHGNDGWGVDAHCGRAGTCLCRTAMHFRIVKKCF